MLSAHRRGNFLDAFLTLIDQMISAGGEDMVRYYVIMQEIITQLRIQTCTYNYSIFMILYCEEDSNYGWALSYELYMNCTYIYRNLGIVDNSLLIQNL